MSEKNINLNDKNINKSNFYRNKRLFNIDEIDVNKILISKKEPCGKKNSFKYFIGYDNLDYIRPVCIKLPQMIGYAKCFDSNRPMSFKIADKKLLKKCIKIWERVSSFVNIEFDSEPVYGDNDKYIKTKIKSYGDKVNTNFQGNKMPKENASYNCLSLIMLDSVISVNKKYYPETLLEECKYKIKQNKVDNLINDDLESAGEFDSEPDSEFESDKNQDCILIVSWI